MTGIDLGQESVKLVRVRPGKGIRRLLNVAIEEIPPAVEGWSGAAAEALRSILKSNRLKPSDLGRVLAAVSGPSVHLRQVEMPALSDAELRSSLRYEARQHIPLENLGEAALDCQVIGEKGSKGEQSVLIVGAPAELVKSRVAALRAAGIDPDVVDVAPLSLLNALVGSEPDALPAGKTVAVFDLGASSSTLVFLRGGGVVYSRSVPRVGASNGAAAEKLEQAYRETSLFYAQMNERKPVEKIWLAGGGALLPDLGRTLGSRLGVPVEVLDATRRLAYSPGRDQKPSPEELTARAPRLAVALGLLYWGNGVV